MKTSVEKRTRTIRINTTLGLIALGSFVLLGFSGWFLDKERTSQTQEFVPATQAEELLAKAERFRAPDSDEKRPLGDTGIFYSQDDTFFSLQDGGTTEHFYRRTLVGLIDGRQLILYYEPTTMVAHYELWDLDKLRANMKRSQIANIVLLSLLLPSSVGYVVSLIRRVFYRLRYGTIHKHTDAIETKSPGNPVPDPPTVSKAPTVEEEAQVDPVPEFAQDESSSPDTELPDAHPHKTDQDTAAKNERSPQEDYENALDTEEKRAALQRIDDPVLLEEIARHDSDTSLRTEAILRLEDNVLLVELSNDDPDEKARDAAFTRLLEIGGAEEHIIQNDPVRKRRTYVIENTKDVEILRYAAIHDEAATIRNQATRSIEDTELLFSIYRNDSNRTVTQTALTRLTETQEGIFLVATQDPNEKQRVEAVKKLDDADFVERIAATDSSWKVRVAALEELGRDQEAARIAYENAEDGRRRVEAVTRLMDLDLLVDSSTNDADQVVRDAAFTQLLKLGGAEEHIIQNDPDRERRLQVVQETEAVEVLEYAAIHDQDPAIRSAATRKIDDPKLLKRIAEDDPSPDPRAIAFSLLQDAEEKQRSNDERSRLRNDLDRLSNAEIVTYVIQAEQDADERSEDTKREHEETCRHYAALHNGGDSSWATEDLVETARTENNFELLELIALHADSESTVRAAVTSIPIYKQSIFNRLITVDRTDSGHYIKIFALVFNNYLLDQETLKKTAEKNNGGSYFPFILDLDFLEWYVQQIDSDFLREDFLVDLKMRKENPDYFREAIVNFWHP